MHVLMTLFTLKPNKSNRNELISIYMKVKNNKFFFSSRDWVTIAFLITMTVLLESFL